MALPSGDLASDKVRSRQPAHKISSHMAGSDRKSTRLNSSHLVISYAVFCLKKKKKNAHAACEDAQNTKRSIDIIPRHLPTVNAHNFFSMPPTSLGIKHRRPLNLLPPRVPYA